MIDGKKLLWTVGGFSCSAKVLGELLIITIDQYAPSTKEGSAYQIRILGHRTHKVATKVWLPDLDAAKAKAVEALNELLSQY